MAWYDNLNPFRAKLNPSQPDIGGEIVSSKEVKTKYQSYYESLEAVNRGVNMIVDDAGEIPYNIGLPIPATKVAVGVRAATVDRVLNYEPNPFQDISTFKRALVTDYLLDGNIFMYWDGFYLFHLPAQHVKIHSSTTTYIDKFSYLEQTYSPNEIIHIKENSFDNIYRGVSRLRPALTTMRLTSNMKNFQDTFFQNGAVPGLVIKSPNTLSEKVKRRMIASWEQRYNPQAGGRRPLVLDGGLEVDSISNVSFKELDFETSIANNDEVILKALGVPPILLDGGNNANIRPNLRLYYLETILSITGKITKGFERFFGYEVTEELSDIPALQPELNDQANYYSTLVNGGVLTPNEARVALGKEPLEGLDDIRVPANVAGSAGDPSEGGRPTEGEENADA